MSIARTALLLLLIAAAGAPWAALATDPDLELGTGLNNSLNPLARTPDNLRIYTGCMKLARNEPLKALPVAEQWSREGGGLGARHCLAIALFESGKHVEAANRLEAIARDMGQERPGLRAELYAQAGQAWMEAGQAENAAAAQSTALNLKPDDPDLWIDRGLSYAAMKAWPRAVSDFGHALELRGNNDVDTLVLRAAAWRNSGNPDKALQDAQSALKAAPEHSEALLERGLAYLALDNRTAANTDFERVLQLVPPDSDAARRAETGLHSGQPQPGSADNAPDAQAPAAKPGGKR